jgi:RNA polymerase sigma-70 factor (ECF subfamily)
VQYKALDQWKRENRKLQAEREFERTVSEEGMRRIHEGIELTESVQQVLKAMQSLPPKYRQVLEMHFLQGLKTGDIAKKTGRAASTVTTLKKKALKALRDRLSNK